LKCYKVIKNPIRATSDIRIVAYGNKIPVEFYQLKSGNEKAYFGVAGF